MSKRKRASPFANGCLIHDVIAVDLWKLQDLNVRPRLHFLSHLHADHTDGLNKSWSRGPIFTSPLNVRLAKHFLTVDTSYLVPLKLNVPHELPLCQGSDGPTVTVMLMVANHVPGSVMFAFSGFFGNILYTADFRYSSKMFDLDLMHNIDTLYLDNTFFFKDYNFPSRTRVLQRLVAFLKSQPSDTRIYVGLRRLGKESALVKIATEMKEKICASTDRVNLFADMDLPDIFTTDPSESRIFIVNQSILTRRFLEEKNEERPSIGILLTALFYNWTGGPYSLSSTYGLHVFEYSDHSSWPELMDFVQRLKPKQIFPIVQETEAQGMMKERSDYLRDRVDLSPLLPFLSREPMFKIEIPEFLHPPSLSNDVSGMPRKRLKLAQGRHERPYRGPKGPVYASTSDTSTTESSGRTMEIDRIPDSTDGLKTKKNVGSSENIQTSTAKTPTKLAAPTSPTRINSPTKTGGSIMTEDSGNLENIEPSGLNNPKATKGVRFSEATQVSHAETTTPSKRVTSSEQTSSSPFKKSSPSKKSSRVKIGAKSIPNLKSSTAKDSVDKISSNSASSPESDVNPNLANHVRNIPHAGVVDLSGEGILEEDVARKGDIGGDGDLGEEMDLDEEEEGHGGEKTLSKKGNIDGDGDIVREGDHGEEVALGREQEIVTLVASTSILLQSDSSSDEVDEDLANNHDLVLPKIAVEIREIISKIREDETLELLEELEERLANLDSVLNQIGNID